MKRQCLPLVAITTLERTSGFLAIQLPADQLKPNLDDCWTGSDWELERIEKGSDVISGFRLKFQRLLEVARCFGQRTNNLFRLASIPKRTGCRSWIPAVSRYPMSKQQGQCDATWIWPRWS